MRVHPVRGKDFAIPAGIRRDLVVSKGKREPGQCDGREPPIGLGAEERMVDTKAMEVVVEEGDRLV